MAQHKNHMKMKRWILAILFVTVSVTASAQFEKETADVSGGLTGLSMSYNSDSDFSLGVSALGGYFVEDRLMMYAKGEFMHTDYADQVALGLGVRYYLKNDGFYVGTGFQYQYITSSVNVVQCCPEVGYAYFLNEYITVEPAVYYNIGLNDFKNGSVLGLKVGIGIFF